MKSPIKNQRGISLFVTLIFLAILLVAGAASMRGTITGQRIARNEAERVMALQAAEAALRDAELDIMGRLANGSKCETSTTCRPNNIAMQGLVDFSSTCTTGLCDARSRAQALPALPNASEDSTLWSASGNSVTYGSYTGATSIPAVSRQPRYVIEGFRFTDAGIYYRITAMGFGSDTKVQVMLQSNFKP